MVKKAKISEIIEHYYQDTSQGSAPSRALPQPPSFCQIAMLSTSCFPNLSPLYKCFFELVKYC
jgi:hypothetical protein